MKTCHSHHFTLIHGLLFCSTLEQLSHVRHLVVKLDVTGLVSVWKLFWKCLHQPLLFSATSQVSSSRELISFWWVKGESLRSTRRHKISFCFWSQSQKIETRFLAELVAEFLRVHLRIVATVEIFCASWLDVCETSIHIWSIVVDHKLVGFADSEHIIINTSLYTFCLIHKMFSTQLRVGLSWQNDTKRTLSHVDLLTLSKLLKEHHEQSQMTVFFAKSVFMQFLSPPLWGQSLVNGLLSVSRRPTVSVGVVLLVQSAAAVLFWS